MKSNRKMLTVAMIVVLLICGAAYAQIASRSSRGMRLGGKLGFPQLGAAPYHVDDGVQPVEAPALSFSYGIFTFPGQIDSGVASANKAGHSVGGYGPYLIYNLSNHGFLLNT